MGFRRILLISLAIMLIVLSLLSIIKLLPNQIARFRQAQNNPNSPNTLTGDGKTFTVKKVIDGDTIILSDDTHVRYLGIDAPEIAHDQESRNGDECYGQEAKKINEDLVLRKKVRLEFPANKFDRYGRTLAWVYLEPFLNSGETVNLEMVKRGAAFYYWSPIPVNYTAELIGTQEKARKEKTGVWGKCGKINGECLVKGNLDRNDKRYYHLPGFKYYNSTAVNLDHGDRWFCSEEDAIKVGFKRAVE